MSGPHSIPPEKDLARHPDAERFERYAHRRRRRRRRATVLLVVLGLVAAAWLTVAHSPLTRRMVIPRLERMLDARVEGGDVSIGVDGLVTIRNAAVRVKDVPGTAGLIFQVKRINVMPSWGRLLGRSSEPLLKEVELVEPLVRFSQSVSDGTMNIAALNLPSPAGGAPELPRIRVRQIGRAHV